MNFDSYCIYENIDQCLTFEGAAKKEGRHPEEKDLGLIENASVVVNNEENKIIWVGPHGEIPKEYQKVFNRVPCNGSLWIPELIECHTHLVHAGERHHDYALRSCGKTYQEIAQAGGGILTTLKHTREASLQTLVETASLDLDRFQKYGVGTVEIKSGYGLSLESEIKILKAIRILKDNSSVGIVSTFMPAHATPPEFKGRTDAYVDLICSEWIPEIAKEELAEYFDAFVEEGFFSVAQAEKMCRKAIELGLKIKLHADQFTSLGGTDLGIELNATSIDHLEKVSETNIKKLGDAKTVAVLCPGASLFTGYDYPPARKLVDAGARVALSTDFNPGTCPSRNLPLMTTLACSQMKLTVPEALVAVTINAAAALGLEERLGTIEAGKDFRICSLKASSYEALPYCFGELE
jgi:imidazolonepropionase